jgi:lipid-binding SYLF domain-containing protein
MLVCPVVLATAGCATTHEARQENARQEDVQDSTKQVSKATEILQKMEADPSLKDFLHQARGIFIAPNYAQGGLGIGAKGGQGIVLVKRGSTWSDPAFYDFGGLSVGLQAGFEGGQMAFIMTNEKAVQQFTRKNNFDVNAAAGLTVIDWSKMAQADLRKADLIAWSDTRGLFGGAAIGLQDVRFDQTDTSAFYGRAVSTDEIFSGKIMAPKEKTSSLKQALVATMTNQ